MVLRDSTSNYHRFPILTNKPHKSLLRTSAPYPMDHPSQFHHQYTLVRGPTAALSLVASRSLRPLLHFCHLPFLRHTTPKSHCLLMARNLCTAAMVTLLEYMKPSKAGQATDHILNHTATTWIPLTITEYPPCHPQITLLHIRPLCPH